MIFTFLFSQGKKKFSEEKRIIYKVLDREGIPVLDENGDVVRSGKDAETPSVEGRKEKLKENIEYGRKSLEDLKKGIIQSGGTEEQWNQISPVIRETISTIYQSLPPEEKEGFHGAIRAASLGNPEAFYQYVKKMGGEVFSPVEYAPPIRNAIDMIQNSMGASDDRTVQNIFAAAKGDIISFDTNAQGIVALQQKIADILENNSFQKMQERLQKLSAAAEVRPKGFQKEYFDNVLSKNQYLLEQVALYEAAAKAKIQMQSRGLWNNKEILLKGDGMELYQKLLEEERNATGLAAENAFKSKFGLGKIAGMLYTGITTFANAFVFIQSRGRNTAALGAALGFGAATVAIKRDLDRNILDSILHPENKAKNELMAIKSKGNNFIIKELAKHSDFYEQLDFSREGAKIFSKFRLSQNKDMSSFIKEDNKKVKDGQKKYRKMYHLPVVSEDDFIQGNLNALLRPGSDMHLVKKRLFNERDILERHKVYATIEWMYSVGLKNKDINNLHQYAKDIVNNSKLTTTVAGTQISLPEGSHS